ncbi:MAG TPA: histidine kinase [Vicinamibacterales bacterium]|nr:histidine kinase [Vicinamibacterales bacterium]
MTPRGRRFPGRFARILLPPRLSAAVTPGESMRIERVIALGRLFLTVIAFVAFDLDAGQPIVTAPLARILLGLFAAHSIAAVLVLRSRPRRAKAFALTTHIIDLLAASLTLPLAAPNNPFFAFFLFVLASAAFRWGFRETVATSIAAVGLMLVRLAIPVPALTASGYDTPERFAVRTAYLVMMGLLLGYLAETGRLLRAEGAAIVHLLRRVRVDLSVTRALTTVANEAVRMLNAKQLLLVVEEVTTKRVFRWDTRRGWSLASTTVRGEPSAIDRPTYFFGPADHGLAIVKRWWPWSGTGYEATALTADGRVVVATPIVMPDGFVTAYPFRRLILAPVNLGDEWAGRVFIFEPRVNVSLIELMEFLRTLIRQVSPAVFSVYLQSRLQAKAGALERARVARELHDGVIQALIGIEMQIEVLRGQEPLRTTDAGSELLRVQHLLREEVLNLRDLMQQMRPAEFDPDELLDHMADMVQRFGRDTGISARFVSDLKSVALEPAVCFELVRIVQEGLANVRKHSAARNVMVRFSIGPGVWRLEIDDDGRGFPFAGRLSQMELDTTTAGPIIIKERVRAIGGQLAIESKPGRGSRLEVLVPQERLG